MKTAYKCKLFAMTMGIVLALNTAFAQEPSVITDSIFSKPLNEQRKIKILLPDEYKPGADTKYDVVYMIDGEWNLDKLSFIYKFAKNENFLPPLILVAIPNTYTSEGNMRDRDFLPEKMINNKKAGGANNFLSFLKNEVIPYIDNKFPTSGENSLFGHSYGGVFTMYALLKEPDLFTNYYCSDPAFHYNNKRLVEMAAETFGNTPALNKTLWINGIENTYMFMGIDKMDSVLKAKAPKGLRWKISYYPNETHNSVIFKGTYDGLKFVYDGYNTKSLVFHPMNGSLIEGKPTRMFLMGNLPAVHYTTDGSEPDTSSKLATQMFEISGPAKLTLKSLGGNKKYSATAKGNFELSNVWPALSNVKKAKNGGLRYTYYEDNLETQPDFSKLKPVKTGIVDSTFSFTNIPVKVKCGCVFEGYLKIDIEGYYIFVIASNHQSKLFINGREIINNDGLQGSDNGKTYVAPLQKGFYPIRIEYVLDKGDNQLHFQYMLPNQNMPVEVPLNVMYSK